MTDFEPRVGDVIIERHKQAQERRIRSINGDSVELVGVASQRATTAKLENVRKRYDLAGWPFNRGREA